MDVLGQNEQKFKQKGNNNSFLTFNVNFDHVPEKNSKKGRHFQWTVFYKDSESAIRYSLFTF